MAFCVQLNNLKMIISTLKSVNFSENAIFQLSEDGMRIIVPAISIQANIYLTADCFTDLRLDESETLPIVFRSSLKVFTDCFGLFLQPDKGTIIIERCQPTEPIHLVLNQNIAQPFEVECTLHTKTDEQCIEYELDEIDLNTLIVRGPDFSTLINDIDRSTQEVELFLSPNAPYFRMTTLGVMQSVTTVEVAKVSDMFLKFACTRTATARYKAQHFRTISKALVLATKLVLRIDRQGLLGMQLMVAHSAAAEALFVEYFIEPQIDNDDGRS